MNHSFFIQLKQKYNSALRKGMIKKEREIEMGFNPLSVYRKCPKRVSEFHKLAVGCRAWFIFISLKTKAKKKKKNRSYFTHTFFFNFFFSQKSWTMGALCCKEEPIDSLDEGMNNNLW